MKKTIIYIGNFRPDHSTENHMSKSFKDLGWKVIEMQEDEISFDDLLAKQSEADFILYTRTWDNIKGSWKEFVVNKTIPTVGFHLDIWKGLGRENEIGNQFFFKCDVLFTADGGHQQQWDNSGIEHYWLPPGVFGRECYMAEPDEKYKKDIIFVGSYHYHPEYPHRPQLIDFLKNTYGDRFAHWGHDGLGTIRGEELNKLYASAKIVVGDSLQSPYYWSDRIPETLGRGGFLLHPFVVGLEEDYADGIDLVMYERGDFKGLKLLIDKYLEDDIDRELIRKNGQKSVKARNTYQNKAREIVNILKEKGHIK